MSEQDTMPEAIGESEAFMLFQEQLSKVAHVDRPILIIGERGTGKELAARRLHYLSKRWNEPLVTLNCAALSASLIESELFGYEPGAFTGAHARRVGRFEAANDGSLFLDEIGLIPMVAQEKILRAVEYGHFERVGSTKALSVDVRIIGATHADLPALAEAGTFKRDLLDRLSFEVLHLPPLRAREEDILLLARHFATRMRAELGYAEPPSFTQAAESSLLAYHWPGNIRELKNTVERAVYRADDEVIDDIVFDPFTNPNGQRHPVSLPDIQQAQPAPMAHAAPIEPTAKIEEQSATLDEAVRALEVNMLREALEACRFNQRDAAARLGLTYHQFRGKYRKYRDVFEAAAEEEPDQSS